MMASFGHQKVEVPQPINLFMHIPVLADGTLGWEPALTKPGDHVVLRAERDCYIVVSACPQELCAD